MSLPPRTEGYDVVVGNKRFPLGSVLSIIEDAMRGMFSSAAENLVRLVTQPFTELDIELIRRAHALKSLVSGRVVYDKYIVFVINMLKHIVVFDQREREYVAYLILFTKLAFDILEKIIEKASKEFGFEYGYNVALNIYDQIKNWARSHQYLKSVSPANPYPRAILEFALLKSTEKFLRMQISAGVDEEMLSKVKFTPFTLDEQEFILGKIKVFDEFREHLKKFKQELARGWGVNENLIDDDLALLLLLCLAMYGLYKNFDVSIKFVEFYAKYISPLLLELPEISLAQVGERLFVSANLNRSGYIPFLRADVTIRGNFLTSLALSDRVAGAKRMVTLEFDKEGRTIIALIVGLQGSGKTTLLRAIEYYLWLKGYSVFDISFDERMQILNIVKPQDNVEILRFYKKICFDLAKWFNVPSLAHLYADFYRKQGVSINEKLPRVRVFTTDQEYVYELATAYGIPKTRIGDRKPVSIIELNLPEDPDAAISLVKGKVIELVLSTKPAYYAIMPRDKREHAIIVTGIVEALFELSKKHRKKKISLFCDEIHEIAPTKVTKENRATVEALQRHWTHARGFGIPTYVATIRPLDINPLIRAKCNTFFIGAFSTVEVKKMVKELGIEHMVGLRKRVGSVEATTNIGKLMLNPSICTKHKLFILIHPELSTPVIIKPVPPPHGLEVPKGATSVFELVKDKLESKNYHTYDDYLKAFKEVIEEQELELSEEEATRVPIPF